MEIGQLFYVKCFPNDVILTIYSQLVRMKTITQSQKEEITNSVNLLHLLTEYMMNNYIFINNHLRQHLYLYNQLSLYFKCKTNYSIHEFFAKFKILHEFYKNFVFYIDLQKNQLNESELRRKSHNIWFKKLNDKDRYTFTSFVTQQQLTKSMV
jgi:hypothetical protein